MKMKIPLTRALCLVVLPVIGLNLTACGKSGGSDSHDPQNPTAKGKVTTNTSQCSSGSAPQSALGAWETDFEINQKNVSMNFQVVLTIESDRVKLQNTCTINGEQLTSTVSARARVTGQTISVLEEASHTEEAGDSSDHMTCDAALKRMTIQYQASGSCLEMKGLNPDETLIMIPAYGAQRTNRNPSSGGYPPAGFPPPTSGRQPASPGSGFPTPGFPGVDSPDSGSGFPTPNYPGQGFPAPGQYPTQH